MILKSSSDGFSCLKCTFRLLTFALKSEVHWILIVSIKSIYLLRRTSIFKKRKHSTRRKKHPRLIFCLLYEPGVSGWSWDRLWQAVVMMPSCGCFAQNFIVTVTVEMVCEILRIVHYLYIKKKSQRNFL